MDARKIRHYLLAEDHPLGRYKAAYFRRFGFRREDEGGLRQALLEHARTATHTATVATEFGTKYILTGGLAAPDGRSPRVTTVWFVAAGEAEARFVTAYPARGGRG